MHQNYYGYDCILFLEILLTAKYHVKDPGGRHFLEDSQVCFHNGYKVFVRNKLLLPCISRYFAKKGF